MCVDSIELYRVDDAGLVDSVRAFWEPPTDPAVVEHWSLSHWEGGLSAPGDRMRHRPGLVPGRRSQIVACQSSTSGAP